MIKRYTLVAVAGVVSVWIGTSAPAFADTVSLQCDFLGGDVGNFSGESVYVLLDLDRHVAVSGYGDSVGHSEESSSTLTEENDRLTWTYSRTSGSSSWIVDYILNRSTLKLLASARGTNMMGNTNTGHVTYACSKVQKQI
ncbi:MAG: hypothetical protein WAU56_13325 [Steroidobacteraceae bacterium]